MLMVIGNDVFKRKNLYYFYLLIYVYYIIGYKFFFYSGILCLFFKLVILDEVDFMILSV